MARAALLLLLAVAIVSINAGRLLPVGENCGEHEEFNACGSSCPSTCEQPTPPVCTLACIPGCDCAEGYVRNAQNKCVLLQSC